MRLLSWAVVFILTGSAVAGIVYIIILFSNTSAEKDNNEIPQTTLTECNGNSTLNAPCYGLSLTRRFEWLAQPSKRVIKKLQLPTERIIITNTESIECLTKPQCLSLVRNIQEEHVSQIADDIVYNFLMDTRGELYEGRGWMLENGQLFDRLRKRSYWIGFIGNLTTIPTDDVRIESMHQFLKRAVSVGNLNVTYKVYCLLGITNAVNISDIELITLRNISQCHLSKY